MRAAAAKTATRPRSRRADRRSIRASRSRRRSSSSTLPIALIDARLQVGTLGSPDRQVRGRGPRLELLQSGAAHEEARVAVGASPLGGRPRQASLLTEVFSRVVDPRSQPSPGAQQRLVGDLDRGLPGGGLSVEGEEPVAPEGVHDGVDRLLVHVEGVELAPERRGAACPGVPSPRVTRRRKICLVARRPCWSVGSKMRSARADRAPVTPPISWYAARVSRSSSRRSKSSVRAYCRSGRAPG